MNDIDKNLDWVFTFGRYKGKNLDWVISNDMSYVEWCISNVDGFTLDVKSHYVYKNSTSGHYDRDVFPIYLGDV